MCAGFHPDDVLKRNELIALAHETISTRCPHLVITPEDDERWTVRGRNGNPLNHGERLDWAGLVSFAKAVTR